MKKLLFTLLALIILFSVQAQILNPVTFDYSTVKKNDNLYEVHIKANIQSKWHIYSVNNPAGGAQATEIKFKEGKIVGPVKEKGKMKTVYEKEFQTNQKYFETTVDFVQLLKLNGGNKISGTITYMVCNDKQCLPPKDVEFKIKM
ncbi:MAG: protein-disulfide reductase DsbD N-terminal domain-containing protein [Bacteroidota bacterium]|nr:protein-disulfide reductase DsbD N-terminal domain-containing protein [Bacteroidota bacterium]